MSKPKTIDVFVLASLRAVSYTNEKQEQTGEREGEVERERGVRVKGERQGRDEGVGWSVREGV